MADSAIRAVLKKIADDDTYRRAVMKDPVGEFAKHGIDIHPGVLSDLGNYMPTSEDIRKQLNNWGSNDCDQPPPGEPKPRSPRTWLNARI